MMEKTAIKILSLYIEKNTEQFIKRKERGIQNVSANNKESVWLEMLTREKEYFKG